MVVLSISGSVNRQETQLPCDTPPDTRTLPARGFLVISVRLGVAPRLSTSTNLQLECIDDRLDDERP
jgi:hypothetical protein